MSPSICQNGMVAMFSSMNATCALISCPRSAQSRTRNARQIIPSQMRTISEAPASPNS